MDLLQSIYRLETLTVYCSVRGDQAVASLSSCIRKASEAASEEDRLSAVREYATFCDALYRSECRGNWTRHIEQLVRYDGNLYSLATARGEVSRLNQHILESAKRDLAVLYALSALTDRDAAEYLTQKLRLQEFALPGFSTEKPKENWGKNPSLLERFYEENGVGIYAKYRAFRYETGGHILPVSAPDPIRLTDLKKYEVQRRRIVENTLAFLAGHPYHNVLLYGDRGTGKSSTVKALLNEYQDRKLRIVEIAKRDISELNRLIDAVQSIPMKFILFIDDLTFSEDDENFNVLKALLEGSLSARPDNVVFYATTNRRHLVKETFSAREGNEVHRGDTLDESMSLADRFGLTVTFMKPDRDEYLEIVTALSEDRKLALDEETLSLGAERFALVAGGRSPRTAKQYVDQLEARIRLKLEI